MEKYNYENEWSKNAIEALKEGKLSKSMIKGKHLKDAGINETLINVKNAIKDGYIVPCEWHTTGSIWDNAVDYFNLEDVKRQIEDQGGLTKYYSSSTKSLQEYRVKGQFIIWGGYPKKPKNKGFQDFIGTLKPNGWIYLDRGGRKYSKGNSIFFDIIK